MNVRKGEDWGQEAPLPNGAETASSDLALRSLVEQRVASAKLSLGADQALAAPGSEHQLLGDPVGLLGGDLWRTMGGPVGGMDRLRSDEAVTAAIDIWQVTVDGKTAGCFVSHLVARRRAWAGDFLVAMNGSWMGDLYLGPKAHPGDGLVDVTFGALGLKQRVLARGHARSGSHLPHPKLTARRATSFAHQLARTMPIVLDGQVVARGSAVQIVLLPAKIPVVI